MTDAAQAPTVTGLDYDARVAGGGDPWFETDAVDFTTPADLQRRTLDVLNGLVAVGLPVCSWTISAPGPRRAYLYANGDLAALTGIPGSESDVRAWAAHMGGPVFRTDWLLCTRFHMRGLAIEIFARDDRRAADAAMSEEVVDDG